MLERRAFSGQAECDLLPRERPSSWPRWGCLAFAMKLEHQQCVEEVGVASLCKKFLMVGTEVCHTASKLQPSAMTERLRKCSRVRLCEPVTQMFHLFGDAGTKSATEAELPEFGESVRVRPDETEGPSLALHRLGAEPEEVEGNLAPGEEMQDDRGREQPDPEELRRRAAEASDDAAGARPTIMGGAAPASAEPRRRKHSEKTSASSRETRGTTEGRRR